MHPSKACSLPFCEKNIRQEDDVDCLENELIEVLLAQSQKQATVDFGLLNKCSDIASNRERKGHHLSRPDTEGSG